MKIEMNGKKHIAPRPKAKLFRQALVISRDYDLEDINADVLDDLVQFVCDVFQNQVTIEDIYENVDGNELIPLIMEAINFVANGMQQEENKKKIMK